jgi:hypothetical protein
MPNHRISDSARDALISTVEALTRRRVNHMESGFPIGFGKLQAALLPKKWRDVVPEMEAAGVCVQSHTRVTVRLRHEQIMREANVVLGTRQQLLGVSWHAVMNLHYDALSGEEIHALARWVNTAVSERRLARLVLRVSKEFLNCYAPTTAHIQARWPEMRVVFDHLSESGHWSRRRVDNDTWKERIGDRVRSPQKYTWDTDGELAWELKSRKARELIGGVLAGALLLPREVGGSSEVVAQVDKWVPLPTDPDR